MTTTKHPKHQDEPHKKPTASHKPEAKPEHEQTTLEKEQEAGKAAMAEAEKLAHLKEEADKEVHPAKLPYEEENHAETHTASRRK
jgi:hypothetical protein